MGVAANHVEALVHATGPTMTWAKEFYSAYRFELSKDPGEDMTIDKVVDLTGGNAKATITLIDVLKGILASVKAGYKEVMIVAHGHQTGLIMPMGPGLGSADSAGLPLMMELAKVISERDRIKAISDSDDQLEAWRTLLRGLSGKKTGKTQWGKLGGTLIDDLKTGAEAEKWLDSIVPTVSTGSMLKNSSVIELLDLRGKVVAAKLKRVEIRACNLGQDTKGMDIMREFLGVDKLLAPKVKTFYGRVDPEPKFTEAEYNRWLAGNTPWLLKSKKDPANNRAYVGDSLYLKMDAKDATPLAVLKLWQPKFQRCASLAAKGHPFRAVKVLVDNNLDIKGSLKYVSGSFYVGGLDPVAGRDKKNPPPAEAHGKAFVLASEPEYRTLIVSDP